MKWDLTSRTVSTQGSHDIELLFHPYFESRSLNNLIHSYKDTRELTAAGSSLVWDVCSHVFPSHVAPELVSNDWIGNMSEVFQVLLCVHLRRKKIHLSWNNPKTENKSSFYLLIYIVLLEKYNILTRILTISGNWKFFQHLVIIRQPMFEISNP